MAPFREQFFDLLRTEESTQKRKHGRHPPTAKLFKYSAFENPDASAGIPLGVPPIPGVYDGPAEEEHMEEDDGTVPDSPGHRREGQALTF